MTEQWQTAEVRPGLADQEMTREQLLEELTRARARLAVLEAGPEALLAHRAVEGMPLGVVITDPSQIDNPIVYCNPAFEALTGYSRAEVLQRNCRFLQGPDSDPAAVEELRSAVREGRGCSVVVINYRKDGTPFWNALTVSPVCQPDGTVSHFVGVQADVSRVKLLEEQARQNQKLEVVGRLAGGIAHNFNNLLTVILGNAEFLLTRLPPTESHRRFVEAIRQAGERAAGVTKQLLTFSSKRSTQPRLLDLNTLLTEAETLLHHFLGAGVELRLLLGPGLSPVHIDPGQVEQILLSLAVNARDAMTGGGELVLETGAARVGMAGVASHPGVPFGEWVWLQVRDDGCGMDAQTLGHLFEPFFTTKEIGQGTGLGLATVHGLVRQNGGHITVASTPGKGTTFTMYFPSSP